MNEASGRSSNLTQKQQREALAAIYGLPERTTDLTYEEQIALRRALEKLERKVETP
jgi:hypothetical protein